LIPVFLGSSPSAPTKTKYIVYSKLCIKEDSVNISKLKVGQSIVTGSVKKAIKEVLDWMHSSEYGDEKKKLNEVVKKYGLTSKEKEEVAVAMDKEASGVSAKVELPVKGKSGIDIYEDGKYFETAWNIPEANMIIKNSLSWKDHTWTFMDNKTKKWLPNHRNNASTEFHNKAAVPSDVKDFIEFLSQRLDKETMKPMTNIDIVKHVQHKFPQHKLSPLDIMGFIKRPAHAAIDYKDPKHFIPYFRSFYDKDHKDVLYPFSFKFSDQDVLDGIKQRGSQFEGDTFDREAIRDIVEKKHGVHSAVVASGDKKYLQMFFKEKDLPVHNFTVKAKDGTNHFIDSDVVIEHIMIAPPNEQAQIAKVIRKIDLANGNVMDFLKHLAGALANQGEM
jgi:hypothetical protein